MDLSKFVWLLQRRKLYFARADKLGDPFEGSVPKANAELASYIIQHRDSDPALESYKALTEDEILTMHKQLSVHREKLTRNMFMNCWHMNAHESFAMWKLYSQSSESVCIQTSYKKLYEVLPSWVHVGLIQYL